MDMFKAPFKDNDVISRYMTNIVAHAFMACFECVFTRCPNSLIIDSRRLRKDGGKRKQSDQSLKKHPCFSRKVHEASLRGKLDHIVSATSCLQNCSEDLRAIVMTAVHMSKIKGHEVSVRSLRLYASTVHCCNLILHKIPGKIIAREKVHFPREFLWQFFVQVFWLFSFCPCFLPKIFPRFMFGIAIFHSPFLWPFVSNLDFAKLANETETPPLKAATHVAWGMHHRSSCGCGSEPFELFRLCSFSGFWFLQ